MWRFQRRKHLRHGYPAPFKQMFIGLPENIIAIDAVYERPTDNYILFFTGISYCLFTNVEYKCPLLLG